MLWQTPLAAFIQIPLAKLKSTQQMMEHSNWLQTFSQQGMKNTIWDSIQNMLPKLTWFLLLLALLTAVLLLLLFGPHILNCLVHLVFVRIQATQLQVAMQECRPLPLADDSSSLLVVQGNLVLSYLNLSQTTPTGSRKKLQKPNSRPSTSQKLWVPVS